MERFLKFLVCIDGSVPYTESCLRYMAWLLKAWQNAVADVLYVTDIRQFDFALLGDFSGSLGAQPYQHLYEQLKGIEEKKVATIRQYVEKFFQKENLLDRITFRHEQGSLVDGCQACEQSETGVDLILIGKRGENAARDSEHLGAHLERVVRASKHPCWIACRNFVPPKHLALAYDNSPSARNALQFLLRSNELLPSVTIDLIYADGDDSIDPEMQTALISAETTLKDAGFQANAVTIHDDVGDGIANYVAKHGVDLLLMGAYGHGTIRHLLVGSVTTELMRRCKISVLLFR